MKKSNVDDLTEVQGELPEENYCEDDFHPVRFLILIVAISVLCGCSLSAVALGIYNLFLKVIG